MVDSENSTSLPVVSRRELLNGLTAMPAVGGFHSVIDRPEQLEPIMPLWREWERLHARALVLCEHSQQIETRLVRSVGFPQVFIPSSDGSRGICAQSHSDIDQAVAAGDCSQEVGAALHSELTVRRARWDADAEALGFDEANREELAAWREQEEAARAIFRTKAVTLAGVEIKLALMIQHCATFSDDPDFPLPQLRSTLDDVKRLRRALDALQC